MSEPQRGWFRRNRTLLTIAAEIATVLVLVAPVGVWVYHHTVGRPPAPTTSQSQPQSQTQSQPPGGTVPQTGGAARYFVVDLPPYTGGGNEVSLPHPLSGKSGYDHALVIRCPANQSGDGFRSVTYALEKRYTSFHATLLPYFGAPDEAKVRYEVYLDDQRRSSTDVPVNTTGAVDVDVYGAARMEVRVSCEQPDAVGILADAYLVHN
jgi:hypothetical protein